MNETRAALILIDMQQDVVRGRWWTWWPTIDDVVANCVDLVAACRERDIPVIFTRVEYAPDGSNTPQALRGGPAEPTEYLVEGTPGVEFIPEFAPIDGELDAVKNLVSAFDAAGVPDELDRIGATTVLVAGLAVEGGVNATVTDDRAEPLDVVVVSDCVAAFTEDAYRAHLDTTFPPRASIRSWREAIDHVTGPAGPTMRE